MAIRRSVLFLEQEVHPDPRNRNYFMYYRETSTHSSYSSNNYSNKENLIATVDPDPSFFKSLSLPCWKCLFWTNDSTMPFLYQSCSINQWISFYSYADKTHSPLYFYWGTMNTLNASFTLKCPKFEESREYIQYLRENPNCYKKVSNLIL